MQINQFYIRINRNNEFNSIAQEFPFYLCGFPGGLRVPLTQSLSPKGRGQGEGFNSAFGKEGIEKAVMKDGACGIDKFQFAAYSFYLEAIDSLELPLYKGSTLRGGFGHALKNILCLHRKQSCEKCSLNKTCVYAYIFENPQSAAGSQQKQTSNLPHPFVIEPPLENKLKYQPGELLIFELILIGRAIDYLPYIIFSFQEFGRAGIGKKRGRFSLAKVTTESGEVIYDRETNGIQGQGNIHYGSDFFGQQNMALTKKAAIYFLTPARLKVDGHLTPELDFPTLMRNLLRRISWLAEIHGDRPLEIDYQSLLSRAELLVKTTFSGLGWKDWERYSLRQNTRMKMGGIIGKITFEGELSEFMPYLMMGEYLHIGKGTVYGNGKYRIEL